MFRIKICGITNPDDARAAAQAGADAIGLNFFSKSRRFVDRDTARSIVSATPSGIVKVGVFVNDDAAIISNVVDDVGLDAVQLHGDESPAAIAQLPAHLRVIRAFRCGAPGLDPLRAHLADCAALDRIPSAILIDSDAGSAFGGTGALADWTTIADQRDALGGLPLILAGGLTHENVSDAIRAVRPEAVDVASGVERQAGRKDHVLVAKFIAAARDTFARI